MSGSNSSSQAAEPVELTVHSLPRALPRPRGRWQLALVVAVCAAPVLASYIAFYGLRLSGRAEGELVAAPPPLPALALTDLQGHAVAATSLKGQWLLTVVQGGACDAGCERLLFAQRQLRTMLGRDRDRLDKLWLVSDDAPLRPELLAAVSQGVAPTILRAPRAALQAWLAPGGADLAGSIYLVDPLGRYMLRWPADIDPLRIKKDLVRLMTASSAWDQPGR
ncbi:MAG: hypothetical protein JO224_04990 [Pelomonas sp.]|nr:hypothetical protein [Roseateles sp.]